MMTGTGLLMFALVQATHLGRGMFALDRSAPRSASSSSSSCTSAARPSRCCRWRCCGNRVIAAGNVACFALGAIIIGATAFLSLYVQGVMGRSAIVAGLVLMAPSVSWPIGSTLGGWLMLRTSYRTTAALGAAPLLVGCIIMIALDPSRGPLAAWIAASLIGIGMGFTNNTFTVATQGSVGWAQRGVATSTLSFMRASSGNRSARRSSAAPSTRRSAGSNASSDIIDRIMDPTLRRTLAASDIWPLTQAIAPGPARCLSHHRRADARRAGHGDGAPGGS